MNSPKKFSAYNMIIVALSIYALGAITADTFLKLNTETSKLITYFDTLICLFFLTDFFIQLKKAPNKASYLKWAWIDLLGSVPMLEYLRGMRIFRLIKLIRIIKSFKTIHQFVHHIFKNKAQGAMSSMGLIAILFVVFSSISILHFEDTPNGNIKTAEDAIWWACATITTAGYGDKFPVTTEGRMIAVFLMVVGVGMFSTFTAYIATFFIGTPNNE